MNEFYRVMPHRSLDWRLFCNRHTNSRLPATYFSSAEALEKRREELQFSLRMAAGLYPWPEKTPLNTKIENVGDFEGYSVRKIMFESRPGFWSTGNLYLPNPLQGKAPAILNFLGHFETQRLGRSDLADYPQQMANFARMGFICLITDMVGKLDSRQISHEYGRDEKELWQSNSLGAQLWNNIRAMDLLCSMPEVDAENIGVTGCSGGATQTLLLAMLDERIKAVAPVNMISLEMQGGCQCENAPGLRRHSDNCEMCCTLAPMPMLLPASTGDWTKNQQTIEFPVIQAAYRLFGAEDKVEQYFQIAGHQHNARSRHRIYSFFARTLMGHDPHWEEQPIETGDLQDYTWFRGEGHAPGFANDEEYYAAHKLERASQVAKATPEEKRRMLAWMTGIQDSPALYSADGFTERLEGATMEKNVVLTHGGIQVPYIRVIPDNWDGKRICLVLSDIGKECVEKPAVQEILHSGTAVLAGDLFRWGETSMEIYRGRPNTWERLVEGGDTGKKHFTTFHYTDDACRVQDVALLWELMQRTGTEWMLWAEGQAARPAVCALPLLKNVKSAALEESALQLEGDAAYFEQFFVPGILLLNGVKGCMALAECPVELF